MNNKYYKILSIINLISCLLSVLLIFLLEISTINSKGEFIIFSSINLNDVINYFILFQLMFILIITILTLFFKINLTKLFLKLSTIISLILPIIFLLTINNDYILTFWFNNIANNIKFISIILTIACMGIFILALILFAMGKLKADIFQIFQALGCNVFLILICYIFNFYGSYTTFSSVKIFKIMLLFWSIYLIISVAALFISHKFQIKNKN